MGQALEVVAAVAVAAAKQTCLLDALMVAVVEVEEVVAAVVQHYRSHLPPAAVIPAVAVAVLPKRSHELLCALLWSVSPSCLENRPLPSDSFASHS